MLVVCEIYGVYYSVFENEMCMYVFVIIVVLDGFKKHLYAYNLKCKGKIQ